MGTSAPISRTTSSTKAYTESRSTHSALKPTRVPVYGGGATPSQLRPGYDASAAFVCPGTSISGTITTWRAAA